MKIKKKPDTYNTYTLEDVSFGQLVAFQDALATAHGPIADELRAEIKWYLDNAVAPPGVEQKEFEAEKDADAEAKEGSDPKAAKPASDTELEHANLGDELPEPPTDEEESTEDPEIEAPSPGLSDEDKSAIDRALGGSKTASNPEFAGETELTTPPEE